ncbi:MAG TPA: hypothetical protein VKR06_12845 [Ktedonosporobacter sp.]|nr:hypothetical protein [Ktedonosporobacter sp.]
MVSTSGDRKGPLHLDPAQMACSARGIVGAIPCGRPAIAVALALLDMWRNCMTFG